MLTFRDQIQPEGKSKPRVWPLFFSHKPAHLGVYSVHTRVATPEISSMPGEWEWPEEHGWLWKWKTVQHTPDSQLAGPRRGSSCSHGQVQGDQGNLIKLCAVLLVIPVVAEVIFLSYSRILGWLNRIPCDYCQSLLDK